MEVSKGGQGRELIHSSGSSIVGGEQSSGGNRIQRKSIRKMGAEKGYRDLVLVALNI